MSFTGVPFQFWNLSKSMHDNELRKRIWRLTLSEWVKMVMFSANRLIKVFGRILSSRYKSMFDDQDAVAEFVIIPVDKALDNIVFLQCVMEANGIITRTRNTTYEPHYEKTGFLHMRKQRRRSASR